MLGVSGFDGIGEERLRVYQINPGKPARERFALKQGIEGLRSLGQEPDETHAKKLSKNPCCRASRVRSFTAPVTSSRMRTSSSLDPNPKATRPRKERVGSALRYVRHIRENRERALSRDDRTQWHEEDGRIDGLG